MRRFTRTDLTREACLRRAAEQDWLAEGSAVDEFWVRARIYRSLALVARPAEEGTPSPTPRGGDGFRGPR